MTKAKTKRTVVRALAIVLAVLMPLLTTVVAFAEPETELGAAIFGQKKYDSPDINALTGHGEEPEELSVSAGATYQEKAWYEYVTYSEHAVASERLNDDTRLLFYDPYTYTNAMIMDVQFDAKTTDFDTMSTYTVSTTASKTISNAVDSTYTSTSAEQTSGKDVTHSNVTNSGTLTTTYNHSIVNSTQGSVIDKTDYHYHKEDTLVNSATISANLKEGVQGTGVVLLADVGGSDTVSHHIQWLQDDQTKTTTYSNDYATSTNYTGDDTVTDNTASESDGWTELSARVTKTVGASSSTRNTWSEQEGTTVTKTYAATHFASDGVTPLPWAIVHYTVQMPMKCCLQVKYSGEWVTISTVYCLVTTIQGTCRAWMQNGQVYYEDWGSGEPVVATDFWSQFLTKDQLMSAYQSKLYPVGGAE